MDNERHWKRTPQQERRRRMPKGKRATRPDAQVTSEAALATLAAMPSKAPVKGSSADDYPLSQVLHHYLCEQAPKPGAAKGRVANRHSANVSLVMTLAEFFGAMTIGDLGAEASRGYDNHRQAMGGRRGNPLRPGGRAAEKALLRKAVRLFIDDHGLVGSFDLPHTGKAAPFGRFRIRRQHLARLLWAARGRTWNEDLGTWSACPPWDREWPSITTDPAWTQRLRIKRDRAHAARAIIVAAYTASKASCVKRLLWRAGPDGVSHLSLDGVPMLYRLGPDAASRKLAGQPVMLNRRVCAHLTRWRALDDERGFVRVIHYRDDKEELALPPTQSFRHIAQDAGLPKHVRFDDLRLSAGAAIAKRKGMALRSGALLLGVATPTFMASFGHLAASYQERILAAFGSKPGGRRTSP